MIAAFGQIYGLVKRQQRRIILMYGCMVLYAISNSLFTLMSGPVLATLFIQTHHSSLQLPPLLLQFGRHLLGEQQFSFLIATTFTQSLWFIPVIILLTALVKATAQMGQFYLLGKIAATAAASLRQQISENILSQPLAFFIRHRQGDVLSCMTHDVQVIELGIFQGFGTVLRDSLVVVSLLMVCFYSQPKLAWFACLSLPLLIGPLARFARKLKQVSRKNHNHQGTFTAHMAEVLGGIFTVQAYCAESHETSILTGLNQHYQHDAQKSYFLRALRAPSSELLGTLTLSILLLIIMKQVHDSAANPADYVSFFIAMFSLYEPLKKLGNTSDYIMNAAAALERIAELPQVPSFTTTAVAKTQAPVFTEYTICYQQVSCQLSSHTILKEISFTLNHEKTLAIVGASGAGKTTLARMLPRFYEANSGCICIGGHDIKSLNLRHLRSMIGYVDQETFLFNRSIAANIAYGLPDHSYSHEALIQAASVAQATDFIMALPQGFDTVVGERGQRLSGGQRQRIGIARALLHPAPILILDEATSQLDGKNEALLQLALQQLLQHKTAMIIAHRLSTIIHADCIIVLDQGRIVACDTHAVLLQSCAIYQRLFDVQQRPLVQPALCAS